MTRGSVLVVDDDADVRTALAGLLEAEGFDVRIATNGAEALRVMNDRGPPDVVLLDVVMPVMNGYDCARRIAETPEWSAVVVLICSAEESALASGVAADGYLPKPVELDTLLTTLDELLPQVHGERVA